MIILSIVFARLNGLHGILIAVESYEKTLNEGNIFILKQMYKEALDAYESAILVKPTAHEAWYNKAVVLDYLGKCR